MTHLTDEQLVRWSASALPPEAEAHLQTCAPCRETWERQVRTWQLLARHTPDVERVSVLETVMGRARAEAPAPRRQALAPRRWMAWAAALLVGASAGWLGQGLMRPGPIAADVVARETLRLPEFQNASPGNFAATVLGMHRKTRSPRPGPPHTAVPRPDGTRRVP